VVQEINFGNRLISSVEGLAPVVTRFAVEDPTPSVAGTTNQRLVNVTLEATDAGGSIAAWMITESATAPAGSSTGWLTTLPTAYTITGTGDGLKTLYAWVKDASGNVSALTTTSKTQITLDTTAPVVTVTAKTTSDRTPSLEGTVNDPTATVLVTVNGVTYTAVNNGDGLWMVPDNTISPALVSGTYSVDAVATDLAGNQGTDATLEELTIEGDKPTATLDVSNLTVAGSELVFTVTYQAGTSIDMSSVDSQDIRVAGPNGFNQAAVLIGVSDDTDGSPRTAYYEVSAPNGKWTGSANGTYTVVMQANQVSDTSLRYVPAGTLGQFQVAIPVPSVTISDAQMLEGDSGQQAMEFEVTLSESSEETVTVDYATADGTAKAGSDYAAASGTLTFQPGQTSQTVIVSITGDKTVEPDETFTVRLSNPANATLADSQATGTILNDDTAPMPPAQYFTGKSGDVFDLDNTSVLFTPDTAGATYTTLSRESVTAMPTDTTAGTILSLGDNGSVKVSLTGGKTVKLFGKSYSQVYVGSNGYITFTQSDTDATESLADHFDTPRVSGLFTDLAPSTNEKISSQVSYRQLTDRIAVTWLDMGQPGMSSASNTFQIEMYFDGRIQITWLDVYAAKAVVGLSDGQGLRTDFTETDLSTSDLLPTLSVSDASILEGNSGVQTLSFEVRLSNAISEDVTVRYATVDGTATAGTDYTAKNGILTIPAGQTTATIQIPVLSDTIYELDETLTLKLSQPTNAVLLTPQATGTILNDDVMVAPVVDSFTVQSLGTTAVSGYTDRRDVKVVVSANDPDGTIAGWAITETATAPAVDSAVWKATKPDHYTITSAGDGVKTLYLWVKDNYGTLNEPGDQARAVIILDTTGPAVTLTSTKTKDTTPALTGTIDDPTATVKVTVRGVTYDAVNNGDGFWTLADNKITTPLPDGVSEVVVVAKDQVGNQTTLRSSVELDNVAPVLVSWALADDSGVSLTDKITKTVPIKLTLTFSEAVKGDDTAITIKAPNGSTLTPSSVTGWGTSVLVVTLTSPSQQGDYSVVLSGSSITDLVDNPFNSGAGQTLKVTLDTKSPTLKTWTVDDQTVSGPAKTTDQSPVLTYRFSEAIYANAGTISVKGPDGSTVAAVIEGTGTDTITVTFDTPLTVAGLYTVTFRSAAITDLAGNSLNAGTNVTATFTLDIPLPKVGTESVVPSVAALGQFGAAMDTDARNNFVVAWYGPSESGADLVDVYVRQFDSTGSPLGAEQVVTTTAVDLVNLSGKLDVAVADDGRFVVAWETMVGSQAQVNLKVFSASGAAVSDVIKVTTVSGQCYMPDLAINRTTGAFVLATTSQSSGYVVPGDMYSPQVYLQRFSATGSLVGDAVKVSGTLSTYGKAPHVTMDSNGKVLVVWNADKLYGRFVTSAGVVSGSEFVIVDHSVGDGLTETASVDMASSGKFVVAWDEDAKDVYARLFNADGTAAGDAFQVDSSGAASEPAVAMASDGSFTIAWSNLDKDGSGSAIMARRYSASGTAVAQEVRVNTLTQGDQTEPTLATGSQGRILVCWSTSDAASDDGTGLHAQLFDTSAPVLTMTRVVTTSTSPALSGTVDEDDATIRVTVAGQTVDAVNNGDGTWTVAEGLITLPNKDDLYTVTVTGTDVAGNVGSATGELVYDVAAPTLEGWELVKDTAPGGTTNADLLTGDTTPKVVFTFSEPVYGDGSSLTVYLHFDPDYPLEGSTVTPASVTGWGTNQLTVAFDFTGKDAQDGYYTILLNDGVVDRAGKSIEVASARFQLDKTAPLVFINKLETDDQTPTLSGYIYDSTAQIKVRIGTQTYYATNNANEDSTWTLNQVPTLTPGTYNVVVTAEDAAGNVSTDSMTLKILLVQEDFSSFDDALLASWETFDQGNVGGESSWGPATGSVALAQTGSISSNSTDTLARKGTYCQYVYGSDWTDYKVNYTMQTSANGDIGLMFRVKDDSNYYRFSWNLKGERRLVKCVDGKFTLLASDKVAMTKGKAYDVSVLADGGLLEVSVGGSLVFSVRDTSITGGTMAFYCTANNQANFSDLSVENEVGVNQAPRIMTFGASATRIFDDQTVQFSSSVYDPDSDTPVTYKWVLDEGQGTFSNVTIANPVFTPANVTSPMVCKIHLEISDGVTTVKSQTVAVEVYDADATVFLSDDFGDKNTDGWVAKDQTSTTSSWSASTGTLVQTTDAVTSLVWETGTIWTATQTDVDMCSTTDGAIGVTFRVQDDSNYYRFVWNNQDGTRRLQKVVAGQVIDVATDKAKFVKGQTYKVSIIAFGQYLAVDIDGTRIFGVTDSTFSSGTIGLFSSKNKGTTFDNVVVKNLKGADLAPAITSLTASSTMVKDTDTVQLHAAAYDPNGQTLTYRWLIQTGEGTFSDATAANPIFTPGDVSKPETMVLGLEVSDGNHVVTRTVSFQVIDGNGATVVNDDFSDGLMDGWKVVDQGNWNGPSKWSAASKALVQSSKISRLLDSQGKRGTFAKYSSGDTWTDYEATVSMRSPTSGDMGLMFRVQDDNNYYRFSMNAKDGVWRLVKCQGGNFTQLASVSHATSAGQTYSVQVLAIGSVLKVYVDHTEVFSVTDASFGRGTIALYGSSNPGVSFDNVVVRNEAGGNLAPVISSITATPGSITDDQTTQLDVKATDPEGSNLTYAWTVESGQGTLSDATVANPVYTPPDVTSSQTFTLKVDVSDGQSTVSQNVDVEVVNSGTTPDDSSLPVVLNENFSDGLYDGWTIVNQGNYGGTGSWSASSKAMVQSSGTYRLFDNSGRRGTFAKYAAGTSWDDYEVVATLKSNSTGDIGLMFRVQDDNNYYRFSMSAKDGSRRLVKCQNGVFTQLAADNGGFKQGQAYRVKIKVQGSAIEVLVDGAQVFSVADTGVARGTVALYSYANPGSIFDNVQVSGKMGPSVKSVTASSLAITDKQTTQLKVDAVDPLGGTLTYKWTILKGQGAISDATVANPIFTPQDVSSTQTVTLQVEVSNSERTTTKTLDIKVKDAGATDHVPGPLEWLYDDFTGGTLAGWTVVDQGTSNGPSSWSASTQALVQSSSINTPSDASRHGTFLKYDPAAAAAWVDADTGSSNYEIAVDMKSVSATGEMGVMVRVADNNNYVRFSMTPEYYRFEQFDDHGRDNLTPIDSGGFVAGQTYHVKIRAYLNTISVYVDGVEIYSTSVSNLPTGTIALYSYNNPGTTFDNVTVTGL
jgi:methionine-rich copper-binding protein CopC